ncbi:MAG: alpha/beta fold hydrolase [Hyphomicrobiales bacterium]
MPSSKSVNQTSKANKMGLLDGFEALRVKTSGAEIAVRTGGDGPPLLLVHGYPQTKTIWHKVAPALAKHFTLIMPDLRGYGESSKPATADDCSTYSKREMAHDLVEVMANLGHDRFQVAGHDRGGRVAHRMAADWPQQVERLCVLDIAPTREMYARTDMAFARAYWHWFFLIQPAPLPEKMILANPEAYFLRSMSIGGKTPLRSYDHFHEDAQREYLRCLSDPDTVHAMCNDYRAAASIDLIHDDADGDKKLSCPMHVIWGKRGVIERCFDAPTLWKLRAHHVTGERFDCGHYIPEERPEETIQSFLGFFEH